ncbi:toprim domain-containing protein [Weizmannia sp. CD-2023]|uniref:toprim domain-containing protein n=1 Tax=Heyndrickxia TaxID=2837504 RepID=UPI002E2489F5|nr:toprim domain-containing protein [Weizmannia sp. CD-2023]MED4899765.1 toprim domain-containing protein [Weizmannia sp. CD-2023]
MLIRGYEIQIDYLRELKKYEWEHAKWTETRLICRSPFRYEKHPSFAVNLETGVWIDSGGDGDYYKGNFVSLVSFLRNETYVESEEYLLETYDQLHYRDADELELDFEGWVQPKQTYEKLDEVILKKFAYRCSYLEQRGIAEIYQRAVKIGYDPQHRAISIPWFDKNGDLVAIKFRSVLDKRFWYYSGGQPVRNHLWGMWLVHLKHAKRVFIVESEIDALTLWAHKIPAVAVGGSSMTDKQRKLILEGDVETIVLATDNDRAGRRLADSIRDKLNGFVNIEKMWFPAKYKDVNDLPPELLIQCAKNTEEVTFNF